MLETAQSSSKPGSSVTLVFDGYCVMCSGFARYVAARDKAGQIDLVASQSPPGRAWHEAVGMNPDDPDSNLVVERDGTILTHSASSIRVLELIGWPRPTIVAMRAMPRPIRDAVYRWVARHRFKIFGRRDVCAFVPARSADGS